MKRLAKNILTPGVLVAWSVMGTIYVALSVYYRSFSLVFWMGAMLLLATIAAVTFRTISK